MADRQFGSALRAVERRTILDLPGPCCEVSLYLCHRHYTKRTLEQCQDVVRAAFRCHGLRAIRVRTALVDTFCAQHQQPVLLGNNSGWVPSRWNKPQQLLFSLVINGDGISCGLGYVDRISPDSTGCRRYSIPCCLLLEIYGGRHYVEVRVYHRQSISPGIDYIQGLARWVRADVLRR